MKNSIIFGGGLLSSYKPQIRINKEFIKLNSTYVNEKITHGGETLWVE